MTTDAEILALEEARYAAMLRADIAALDHLLDSQLTYTDSSGRVDTKAQYLDTFRAGLRKYKTIERRNVRVVVRDRAALVFCDLHIQAVFNGAIRDVQTRALAVWTQEESDWRLLALHSIAHSD